MDSQKHLFDLEPHIHYLNGAYMSPLLRSAEAAGIQGIAGKKRPYQIAPTDFFGQKEKLRGLFAQLVGAAPDQVALIPAASYGMAVVARNLRVRKGQRIIIPEAEFPSNYYPWERLARENGLEIVSIPMPLGYERRGATWNQHILDAIDERTALVACGHVHWANGTRYDLKTISDKVHQYGGLLVVDGTQSVGALPLHVHEMGIDALICAGYKWLMGAYGLGYAFFSDYFADGVPLEENWINREASEQFNNLTQYRDGYQPGARRYDMGEHSNFILVPMAIAALEQLLEWGADNIQQYCHSLTAEAIPQWRSAGYWVEDEAWRSAHLLGIQIPRHRQPDALQDLLREHHISVSVRGGFVRISPNVYNDAQDIAALNAVLMQV